MLAHLLLSLVLLQATTSVVEAGSSLERDICEELQQGVPSSLDLLQHSVHRAPSAEHARPSCPIELKLLRGTLTMVEDLNDVQAPEFVLEVTEYKDHLLHPRSISFKDLKPPSHQWRKIISEMTDTRHIDSAGHGFGLTPTVVEAITKSLNDCRNGGNTVLKTLTALEDDLGTLWQIMDSGDGELKDVLADIKSLTTKGKEQMLEFSQSLTAIPDVIIDEFGRHHTQAHSGFPSSCVFDDPFKFESKLLHEWVEKLDGTLANGVTTLFDGFDVLVDVLPRVR